MSMKKILLTILLSYSSILIAGPEYFVGKAISNKNNKHVYTEEHSVKYEGERVKEVFTLYKDPNGKEVASLKSVFKNNFHLPDTHFIDKETGYEEITRLEGDKFIIKTKDPKKGEKKGDLSTKGNIVCGQGYHNYIIENLNKFKIGEKSELKFVIPSMRDYFTFDLTYLGPVDPKKPDHVSLRLDITNWILKMFADKIQVTYSKKDKTLIAYNGLTNLTDKNDDQYDAKISYSFPDKPKK